MKTLTVMISDQAAARLARQAVKSRMSAEEIAARAVEDAYAADWFEELDPEGRAAIEEGLAQADRGEFASAEEVKEAFDRFGR